MARDCFMVPLITIPFLSYHLHYCNWIYFEGLQGNIISIVNNQPTNQPTNQPPPHCRHANILFPCSQLAVSAPDENSWPWRLQRSRRATSARRDDPTTLPPDGDKQRWDGDRPAGQRVNTRSKSRCAAWWRVGSIWDSCPLEDSINHEN